MGIKEKYIIQVMKFRLRKRLDEFNNQTDRSSQPNVWNIQFKFRMENYL